MRKRINTGTLVWSTNRLKAIKAKRLIIKVVYESLNYKTKKVITAGIRTSIQE